ncbi:receptor-like protein 6 [Syzygium oleosum]|uniref:receptor-like protein 6 n=1 Tax=Syzygium oleosum TaxID=219896 RepID=UPI0024BBBB0A|nr:receptor-like protein 6 [Syzygium oleosum]
MGWNQILGLLCFLFLVHSSLPFALPLCPPDQRDALLLFKNSFVLDSMASHFSCDEALNYPVTSYPKTNLWNKSLDCCSWDGVTCDNVTGNVIGLDLACSWLHGSLHSNSSLLLLQHLRSLDLSGNDFAGSQISPNLTAFTKLTHLNLSRSHFFGTIPSEISRLSKLVSLDLSDNYDVTNSFSFLVLENSIFTMIVHNLTEVKKLVLDEVDMSMVSPISLANLSSSLTHLTVSACSLAGIFPETVFRLPSLIVLNVHSNLDLSGILPKYNWTSPLVYLSLDFTSFSGEIPDSIGNVKRLTVLGLSGCRFTGRIPSSMWNLEQLRVLYLAGNNFNGVVEFEIFTKFKNLQMLNVSLELNLTYNTLKYTFPKLEVLGLPFCNLTKFPYFLSLLKRLTNLDLSSNRISGEIPSWICQLSSLQQLSLYNNSLFGNIPSCFGNMTNLFNLRLSTNKLQGELPRSLVKCVKLLALGLNDNEFSDIFPYWLEAPQLHYLYLQANRFHGSINLTAFGLSFPALEVLLISDNNFTGQWPKEVFSNTSLAVIDMSNNKFEGPIPLPSPVTHVYCIASNNITGRIPSLICNATKLEILDLSNNCLTGSLPRCLTSFSTNLSILKLRMNHLGGTIPESFSWRNSLTTLDLSQNQIEGTLPRSLVKCKYLEILDLDNNHIEDTFPRWLGELPELKVLILRSNKFKGLFNIPRGAHLFVKLHILDLSNNHFGGPLPINLIMNLKAMMDGESGQDKSLYMEQYFRWLSYETRVSVMMKGREIELMKIGTAFTILDLSHNSFQGDIPGVFGHLHFLLGLNLSHNHLIGSIPPTFGNLTNLEWLDLSSNKFSGGIPRELGDLAFLGYLNLSKNQLTGRIPQDKQLSTFSSDSFRGNPGLCGSPLPKACPGDAQPPPSSSSSTFDHDGQGSWFKKNAVWIGYAVGISIGISIAYIAFETGRPKCLTRGVRKMERRAARWMEKPKQKAVKFHGQ